MEGFVTVSTTRLLTLLIEAQDVIETFYVDKDAKKKSYKEFSFRKMRYVEKQYINTPSYHYCSKAVLKRIDDLIRICKSVDLDNDKESKEVTMSLLSFNELNKIVNKDWSFNEVFFINY